MSQAREYPEFRQLSPKPEKTTRAPWTNRARTLSENSPPTTNRLAGSRVAFILAGLALAATSLSALTSSESGSKEAEHSSSLRLGRQATWVYRSFLRDETDDATTLRLEFDSYLGAGKYEIKNHSYFEVAEYPRAIPGQPLGNESPGVVAADGINDLMTAFWISKKEHRGKHQFSPGFAAQFPTASSDVLGSGKWSVGPSFDYSYRDAQWRVGAKVLQLWSVAGDSDRKDVNMLLIKPFAYFRLSDKWDLKYVPYGIPVYWNKPSGERVYLPVGGGAQRRFQLRSAQMNVGLGYYYNVLRPTRGTVSDLRFVLEFVF